MVFDLNESSGEGPGVSCCRDRRVAECHDLRRELNETVRAGSRALEKLSDELEARARSRAHRPNLLRSQP